MNRFVTVLVVIAALIAGSSFFINYGKLYRGRRILRSERKKVRALRWGLSLIIAMDFFISYLAASANWVLSLVLFIVHLGIFAVLLIAIWQSPAIQAGVLGSIAIPCIICSGILLSGIFPRSLAMAFFSIGGVLLAIAAFELFLAVANQTARNSRSSPNPSP